MITGTMIAGIMGLSRWTTIQDVWLQAKGLAKVEQTEEMLIGNMLEDTLAKWYEQEIGSKIKKVGLIVWEKNPDFGGHPDGIDEKNRRVVEFKTTRKLNGCAVEWNCQVQWYMLLTGLSEAYVYAVEVPSLNFEQFQFLLSDGYDLRKLTRRKIYLLQRDDKFLESAIVQAKRFLELLKLDEPPKEWNLPASLIYPSGSGVIEATNEVVTVIQKIKEINEQIASLEKTKDNLIETIKAYMRDKEELRFGNTTIATWQTIEQESFDSKRLKVELPEIYSKYSKKVVYRRFKVK